MNDPTMRNIRMAAARKGLAIDTKLSTTWRIIDLRTGQVDLGRVDRHEGLEALAAVIEGMPEQPIGPGRGPTPKGWPESNE